MTEENIRKKEYLEQYRKAVREMERRELRINEIRMNKMHPSLMLDGLPHGSVQADLSSYVAKLDDEEQKYLKAKNQGAELCAEIMDKIEKMEDENEKDVLTYRYIKLMKWEGIGDIMGYSLRWVHEIHGKALNHFQV